MTWQAWGFLAAFVAMIAILIFGGFGCSHAASNLERKQRAVQDCILSGGHARLGPADTILCE